VDDGAGRQKQEIEQHVNQVLAYFRKEQFPGCLAPEQGRLKRRVSIHIQALL